MDYHNSISGNVIPGQKARIGENLGQYFKGQIDDIQIYSRALNESEITLLYQNSFVVSTNPQVFNSLDENITITPNPTSGIINIIGFTQSAEAKIYSIQGQLMKTLTQVEDIIDVSDLPNGIFILNLVSGKETVVRKIVIEK